MNFERIFTVFLRQAFLLRRSFHRLLGIFYWSALELFLWGYLTSYLARIGENRLGFLTVLIGTVILWNFLMRIQQGVAISFLEDVWAKNFMNLFASPLSIKEYIAGLVLVAVSTSLVSIAFMTGISWLLFSYNLFQFGFLMIPFVFVLFFFGLALGLYTTAMILRFGPSSEILAWSIPALIPPFSGVFYPLSALPQWIQSLAALIPSSYVFEGMRSVMFSGTLAGKDLILAAVLSLIYCVIAYFLLLKTYRYVLREGKLIRFQTD